MRRSLGKVTTKHDLMLECCKVSRLRQAEVRMVVDMLLRIIPHRVSQGESVEIKKAMTFYPAHRKARPARNPRTGEVVMVPERTVMACRFPRGYLCQRQ